MKITETIAIARPCAGRIIIGKVVAMMDVLCRTTGWGCAWGSMSGALLGGIIDFLVGTSGLVALVVAGVGSLVGSYVGLRIGSKRVGHFVLQTNFPLDVVSIHKQHGAMWSMMGAMVGGVVGSTVGAGLAAFGWMLSTGHVPTIMDFMSIANVMMGGGMGGMTGGVIGAWWSAVRAGFVGEKRNVQFTEAEKEVREAKSN